MDLDQVLLAQIEDKIEQCNNRYTLCVSQFLDLHQRKIVDDYCKNRGINYGFYGAYPDSERALAVFIPEFTEIEYVQVGMRKVPNLDAFFNANPDDQPLALIKVKIPKGGKVLSHRDYLGSLLSLGLKREVSGDILVRSDGADIVVLKEMAEFVELNYSKAGHTNLSVSIADVSELDIGEIHIEEFTDTVASLRLDNIVASAFKLSRAKAADAIKAGIVYVNNMEQTKCDKDVEEMDKIVLRGKGKVVLSEIGNKSKKDRLFVKFNIYK